MPPGRSLKEQWLKFVGLEYFHVFGLAQGMKTSSSWQHSMSENQVPLGTVSPQDEKANHSSIACCCPRPLCSSQYLWPVARALYLVGLPMVSLTRQYLLHTDGSCASSQCQEPSRHSSLTGFLHLFKKPIFSAGHFQPSTIFSWPGFLHRRHLVYLDSGCAIVTTVSECVLLSCAFRVQLKLASQPRCHPPRRCSEWFSPPSP